MKSPSLRPIRTRIPILDLKRQYSIIRDENINVQIRALVGFTFLFTIAYFIMPIDLIPDFLLGLGYIDDLSIYAVLREISYTGAEDNLKLRKAVYQTIKSRFTIYLLIFVIVAISLISGLTLLLV